MRLIMFSLFGIFLLAISGQAEVTPAARMQSTFGPGEKARIDAVFEGDLCPPAMQ